MSEQSVPHTWTILGDYIVWCVIYHQIHDEFNLPLVCFVQEFLPVIPCAIYREDLLVVSNTVAHIWQRIVVDWRQLDDINPKLIKIIQLGYDTVQVTYTITWAAFKGINVDLVNDTLPPPSSIVYWTFRNNIHGCLCLGCSKRVVSTNSYMPWPAGYLWNCRKYFDCAEKKIRDRRDIVLWNTIDLVIDAKLTA